MQILIVIIEKDGDNWLCTKTKIARESTLIDANYFLLFAMIREN
jgi:hypothetical protein